MLEVRWFRKLYGMQRQRTNINPPKLESLQNWFGRDRMTNLLQESKVAQRRGTFSLLFAGLSVVLLLSTFVGCDRGVPDWRDILKAEPSPTPTPSASSIKTTNELIVYLDESGSMAGYVTRDGQTIFGKSLRELRYATGTFAGSDVRVLVRHVGSDVGPPLPDMDLTTASQDPSVYRAGETNLAGAINSFKVGYQNPNSVERKASPQGDGSNSDPPEPPQPARFQILVTDGVQSTRRGNSIQDCMAGSDQFCVRQKIGELLKAGWAGCILGVRADFHGKVYSEVSGAGI